MRRVRTERSALGRISSVHSLSPVRLFVTPWTAAHQAFLSITNSRSLLKFTSIESVTPSNLLILCHPFLLLPSIFPSIRVFSGESALCKRSDVRKDLGQEEKGTTKDEVIGWHHQLNEHEFEQTLGDSEGRGSPACCSPWGCKESDTT